MHATPRLFWRALAAVVILAACGHPPATHLETGAISLGHLRQTEATASTTTTTSPPPTTAPHVGSGHAVRSGTRPTLPPAPHVARGFEPNVERWRAMVATYGWPVDEVLTVMTCESHGNPDDVGPRYIDRKGGVHYPHGLLQVMDGPFDPGENLRVAFSIWSGSRWRQWSCKP
jgi:hypothetical protein